MTPEQISAIDAAHLWHPYSTIGGESVAPVVAVAARGAWLTLIRDGRPIEALDAMSSWWTAIHGHGHPALDAALTTQLGVMNHVMFGGLTHEPAARLAQLLVDITPRAWTPSSSATPGRCRSRSPSRWRCSTGAAAVGPASTG